MTHDRGSLHLHFKRRREKQIQCTEQPSTHAGALGHCCADFAAVLQKYKQASATQQRILLWVNGEKGTGTHKKKREKQKGQVTKRNSNFSFFPISFPTTCAACGDDLCLCPDDVEPL